MGVPFARSTNMRLGLNRPVNTGSLKIPVAGNYGGQYETVDTNISEDYRPYDAQHMGITRPQNTRPVWLLPSKMASIFGTTLDNRLNGSHFVSMSPNAAAFDANKDRSFGYVPPYLRTSYKRYAKVTDGRTYKSSYTAEFPYRQNFARLQNPQYVTSPGKNFNQTKLTGQDALLLQMLRRRGYIQ